MELVPYLSLVKLLFIVTVIKHVKTDGLKETEGLPGGGSISYDPNFPGETEGVPGGGPGPYDSSFPVDALVTDYQTHGLELFFNSSEPLQLIDITDGQTMEITFYLDHPLPLGMKDVVIKELTPDNFDHLLIVPDTWDVKNLSKTDDGRWSGTFNVTGTFLGFTDVIFLLKDQHGDDLAATKMYDTKVQRSDKGLDKIFTGGMIILVAIAYVNMGCAIDLNVIKEVLKKPIAPCIGLVSQYLFMPLTSYFLGYALFYDMPAQWLGLFMIGSSPGGGGSNIWTYLLGGSLDLSVTMTLVSTLAAFAALPMWVYLLATSIFREGNFSTLPYGSMAGMVVALLLPCTIGVLIKIKYPKVAEVLKKMLTPVAVIFIIFAMTFGVYVNFYVFSYITGKVVVAGLGLPWLGFTFGGVVALITRRSWKEVIAISVETGIQNIGLAIGVIKFAMQDYSPLGDLTVVIPIVVSMFTPIPLFIALIAKKIYECRNGEVNPAPEKQLSGIDNPMPQDPETPSPTDLKMTKTTSTIALHNDSK